MKNPQRMNNGKRLKECLVGVGIIAVLAGGGMSRAGEPKPSATEEKLLSRAEIEAKLGQPVVTSKQISDAMTEFYGFSLDEFCDLLKTKESSQVSFQPKNEQAAERLKQAAHLAGNKSKGIEEEYDIFAPNGTPEIVLVKPNSIGQRIGLKLGPISYEQLTNQVAIQEKAEELITSLIPNYGYWSSRKKIDDLLGVKVIQKYTKKTKLKRVEFEAEYEGATIDVLGQIMRQKKRDINEDMLRMVAKDNYLWLIEDPDSWANFKASSWDIGAAIFNTRFAFAVPSLPFYPIHQTIIEASGLWNPNRMGGTPAYWPNKTYQILKICHQIKNLSFAVYRQIAGETVVFYAGDQAILVYDKPSGDVSFEEILMFRTAHPKESDEVKTTLYHFPYKGGMQLISQVYVDAHQQQMVNLKSQTIYCQEGDVSRAIDVTSQPPERLKETVEKEIATSCFERFKWLNGGNATEIVAVPAFTNKVIEGKVTGKKPEAIQGGYLGLPIDSHGLTPVYGGWSVNYNMPLGYIGRNYHGHIYDLTDSEDAKNGNYLGYALVYGEASLMTQAAEFSREYIKQADIQQKVQGEAYQKGQQRIQEELYRLRHQGD